MENEIEERDIEDMNQWGKLSENAAPQKVGQKVTLIQGDTLMAPPLGRANGMLGRSMTWKGASRRGTSLWRGSCVCLCVCVYVCM